MFGATDSDDQIYFLLPVNISIFMPISCGDFFLQPNCFSFPFFLSSTATTGRNLCVSVLFAVVTAQVIGIATI